MSFQLLKTDDRGTKLGTPFDDSDFAGSKMVSKIEIRADRLIDSIRLFYTDGTSGPGHGGSGGTLSTIELENGEYITGIQGRSGQRVDQLTILTNVRAFGPYGGNGGAPFEINVTKYENAMINSLFGHQDNDFLNEIGGNVMPVFPR